MKKHILLIDEDKHELKSFMQIVNNCHGAFKCTYANTATQALEMLRYLEIDFIFINYHLTHINSLHLVSAIRYESKHENAGIYIYAGEMDNETIKMARLLGASGCIKRSADLQSLVSRFNSILSVRQKQSVHD